MSKKFNLQESKSPVTIIYGEVREIKKETLKGQKVSRIEIQSPNRRKHEVLFYGDAPMQILVDGPRSFVVQEKSRVKRNLEPFIPKNAISALGEDAVLSFELKSKDASLSKQAKKEVNPKEVFIVTKETITELVVVDLELNPKSI